MILKRIDELFDFEKGILQSSKYVEGNYDFITASSEWKKHNEYTHNCEALIFAAAASGSLGRTHYVKGKFISSDLCFILISKDPINLPTDLKFYHIIFNLYKKQIVAATKAGTSKEAIGLKAFGEYRLPYFSIELQRKVKEQFDKADNLKRSLFEENIFQFTQIKNLNQAILQEALQGKLVKQDKKEEPANDLLKRIKLEKRDSDKAEKPILPIRTRDIPFEIPENWTWCRLGEICDFITSGSRNWNQYYSKEGDLFIRSQNIRERSLDLTNKAYVSIPEKVEGKRTQVLEADILITITGAGVSNCAFVEKQEWNIAYVSQHVGLIRLFQKECAKWIHLCIISETIGKAQFRKLIYGDKPGLNLFQLNSLIIPLPPLSEQKRIVLEIENQFNKTRQLKEHVVANQISLNQLLNTLLREALEAQEVSQVHNQNIKIAWAKDQKFWQRQLVAMYVKTLREQSEDMRQGEMGIAKYTYLADKIVKANSGFRYLEHNWGPYTLEINECLTNGGDIFVKKQVGVKGFEVFDLGKEANNFIDKESSELQRVQQGFQTIVDAFKPFQKNERTRQLELVASICWLVEKLQTINLPSLHEGMKNWKTPKREVKNKAELFSKEEVSGAIQFIKHHQWHLKLLINETKL